MIECRIAACVAALRMRRKASGMPWISPLAGPGSQRIQFLLAPRLATNASSGSRPFQADLRAMTGTIWIDVTTSRALRDRGPVGITRVERTLGLEAARAYGERVRFMHYDRYNAAWTIMPQDRAAALLASAAAPARSGGGHG